jgi:hypothetical protein
MNRLCRQIDMTIDQDWTSIRKYYSAVLNKLDRGELAADNTHVQEINSTQYNLDHFGSLVMSDHLSTRWGFLTGALLEQMLPWAPRACEIFSPLTISSIAWTVTTGNVAVHCDSKVLSEQDLGICKINFIVDSNDPAAITTLTDINNPEYSESYPTVPGTAWLLDVLQPHSVTSAGYREIVQFKFLNSYAEVAEFSKQIGPIKLGNQL